MHISGAVVSGRPPNEVTRSYMMNGHNASSEQLDSAVIEFIKSWGFAT